MHKKAVARPSKKSPQLSLRRSKEGKIPSGSRYFQDPKHNESKVIVVVELEYKNSFLVRFMSEDKKLERMNPKSFTRAELEKMLTEAKNGLVEITINKATGYVKAVCLKQYLSDTLLGA